MIGNPRMLDLFCGAGGAAMGYHRAGFRVVGVDIDQQPHYPFDFVQADALEYLAEHGHDYDAVHASPPCQGYSIMHNLPWLRGREYPYLLHPTIEALAALGRPYVVENVMGARHGSAILKRRGLEAHGLQAGFLCGAMFGMPFYRHRLFAANWLWLAPGHPKHKGRISNGGRHITSQHRGGHITAQIVIEDHGGRTGLTFRPGYERVPFSVPTVLHDAVGWRIAAEAMGIDWMKRDELTQAIPPMYTEHIGLQLIRRLST